VKRLFSLTALMLCIVMMLSMIPVGVSAAEFTGDDRIVIVLDPGHGTQGVSDETNKNEGAYNMRTARYMKAALEANSSFVVYMTNEADNVNLSFYERVSMADSVNADLIISVHYNASDTNPDLRGMEAWSSVLPRFAMDDLATMCIEYATEAVPEITGKGVYHREDKAGFYWNETYQWDVQGDASGGILSDHYSMITYGAKFGIPTFIIEELFLTNAADVALATDENIKAIAEAQAQAIIDYYTGHEHTYGEVQTDIPLSCVSAGKQSRHCTLCGHRKDVSTIADAPDPDGHFYQPVDINDLKGAWYCVYTRSLKEKAKLDIEEHTGDSLEGIDIPTPVPPPETLPTPSDPEEPDTEPPTGEDGHEHKYKITGGFEVTGGNNGSAVYTCSVCGHKYTETLYPSYDCEKNGHVLMPYSLVGWEYLPEGFVLPYVDVATTCDSEGKKYSFCMVCSYAGDDIEPPFGHTLVEINRVEPTCKDEGTIEYNCTVCNKRVAVKLSALGHDMKVVEEVAATVDTEGKRVESCSVCSRTRTVILPKLTAEGTDDPLVTEPTDVKPTEASTYKEADVTAEEEKQIDLPLPIIAFIVLVILFVAAILIVPVIIRRRRAKIVPEVMEFTEETVAPEELPVEDEKDKEIMSSVIPEIAQVVESESSDAGFSLEKIEIPVDSEDPNKEDTPREDALEALKLSFSEGEKTEETEE